MLCQLQPDCEREAGHYVPCGKDHVPGSPCAYCGKPTPLNGNPCPDCWITFDGLPMADIKGLLAAAGLATHHSLDGREQHETPPAPREPAED